MRETQFRCFAGWSSQQCRIFCGAHVSVSGLGTASLLLGGSDPASLLSRDIPGCRAGAASTGCNTGIDICAGDADVGAIGAGILGGRAPVSMPYIGPTGCRTGAVSTGRTAGLGAGASGGNVGAIGTDALFAGPISIAVTFRELFCAPCAI
jgi:hypothetical protein